MAAADPLDLEQQVLLACLRRHVGIKPALPVTQPPNWEKLLELAGRHALLPVLHRHLDAIVADVPRDVHEALGGVDLASRLHARLLEHRLLEVMRLFAEAGLRSLVFKGPALGSFAPAGAPPRLASDLDLLVPPATFELACEVLTIAGFEVEDAFGWESHLRHPESGVQVDLHKDLLPDHIVRPLTFTDVWTRRRRYRLDGGTVQGLGLADHVLVLCLHLVKDAWHVRTGTFNKVRLAKLLDFDLVRHATTGTSWTALLEHARLYGCGNAFLFAVGLADEVVGLDLPSEVRAETARNPLRRSFPAGIAWLFGNTSLDKAAPTEQALFQLRMRDRAGDRLRLLATPTPEDHRVVHLPERLSFLYYGVRAVRLLALGTRHLGRQRQLGRRERGSGDRM